MDLKEPRNNEEYEKIKKKLSNELDVLARTLVDCLDNIQAAKAVMHDEFSSEQSRAAACDIYTYVLDNPNEIEYKIYLKREELADFIRKYKPIYGKQEARSR